MNDAVVAKKKRLSLGTNGTYLVGKRLHELIDPETSYYKLGSGYTDHRLAMDFGVNPQTIKTVRLRLFGRAKFGRGDARTTARMNDGMFLQEQSALRELIAKLQERVETLENTLFGEAAD